MPDGDRVRQAGPIAGAAAAIRSTPGGFEEALHAGPGEGTGVPGRDAVGCDIERGGARESALPEDAEDGVPCADPSSDRGPAGIGPVTGAAGPKSGRNDQDPARGESGMTR